MTNDTDTSAPTYDVHQFATVLAAENDWAADYALSMAHQIRQSQGWETDGEATESQWIWAALAWWSKHPVPEDEQGSVFM